MNWQAVILENWPVKLVCATLIVAAYIDGKQLRVPNWITFPMVLAGLAYNGFVGGLGGLEWALSGAGVGLLCLLPLYAVGGMGAGDVKLMAGVGAWLGSGATFAAFGFSAVAGGVMALVMVLRRKSFARHYANFWTIIHEFATVKDPRALSQIAAARKPQMLLLPYGIPICIGSIGYFLYAGLL
jgi:prepilin peptidase CpaA